MTSVLVLAGVLLFLAGLLTGRVTTRRRAYLVCQRQALVDNAFRPAIADGFNPVPQSRRRWARDRKSEVQPAPLERPVFHRTR